MQDQSPYDRGQADSYYGRSERPHKWEGGKSVDTLTPEERKQYFKGFSDNEYERNFKDWGVFE